MTVKTNWLCDPIQRELPVSIKFSFDKTVTQSSAVRVVLVKTKLIVSLTFTFWKWNVWEMCVAFFILADKSASDCSADPPWNHHLLPSNSVWQKRWQNIQSRWYFCNQHHNLSWEMYLLPILIKSRITTIFRPIYISVEWGSFLTHQALKKYVQCSYMLLSCIRSILCIWRYL